MFWVFVWFKINGPETPERKEKVLQTFLAKGRVGALAFEARRRNKWLYTGVGITCGVPLGFRSANKKPRSYRFSFCLLYHLQNFVLTFYKTQNHAFKRGFLSDRGAGGIRTLVQTSNVSAFYMLSLCLVFDVHLTRNCLMYTYLLKILVVPPKQTGTLVLTFLVLLNESPSTRAIQEHLASLPCRDEANLTMIQIKRQERNYFRQLKV